MTGRARKFYLAYLRELRLEHFLVDIIWQLVRPGGCRRCPVEKCRNVENPNLFGTECQAIILGWAREKAEEKPCKD